MFDTLLQGYGMITTISESIILKIRNESKFMSFKYEFFNIYHTGLFPAF